MKKRHGTILLAIAVLAGGLLWLLFGRERIEEGRCRLIRKKADPDSQLMALAFQFMQPLEDRPDGVQDLPAGFERSGYYHLKSGDRLIPMVVDSSGSLRLCLDTDGDGILSEERCFTTEIIRRTKISSGSQRFGPISLASPDRVAASDGSFYVNCYRTDEPGLLTAYAAFFRTGKLRLTGQAYQVAVVDGDYDGRFHSILSLPLDRQWRMPASDVFAIDLNHNGKFEISLFDRSEVVPLGKLAKVADDYYAVDIAPDGMSLTLSKTEPQFGTLAVEPNDATVELRLWSDAADQHLLLSREQQLPAGRYKAIYAALRKTDASGEVWTFSSSTSSAFARLGPLEFFTIQPGETTSIRVGPPFVVRADVQTFSSGRVSISPIIVGCAGEEYATVLPPRRGRPAPIAFKIVDEKGAVLIADDFEYG